MPSVNCIPFGTSILISATRIFYQTTLSYAFVNLKPIVPGHVLVCPKRIVNRFGELTREEMGDLFCAVQKVGSIVERAFEGEALTISIQDGEQAGQTIKHVHVHVIPRRKGDFIVNDDIYDHLEHWGKLEDAKRVPRTPQQMDEEAAMLRKCFTIE
jgi:bis(5'-adenosyl)-triphosphatase